ncbi:hypothetical protein WICPIJ_005122 [Wickerhamomyces pijperi]|uniref:Secreted protein n=1 Tax=Wickerhamomyces pijperi TaxID=599730 RepID=A0A9P8Q6C9_WICPI|nr:hypothetical protein WICPIJ_005122 [Wickerhamomyces pijperi]
MITRRIGTTTPTMIGVVFVCFVVLTTVEEGATAAEEVVDDMTLSEEEERTDLQHIGNIVKIENVLRRGTSLLTARRTLTFTNSDKRVVHNDGTDQTVTKLEIPNVGKILIIPIVCNVQAQDVWA